MKRALTAIILIGLCAGGAWAGDPYVATANWFKSGMRLSQMDADEAVRMCSTGGSTSGGGFSASNQKYTDGYIKLHYPGSEIKCGMQGPTGFMFSSFEWGTVKTHIAGGVVQKSDLDWQNGVTTTEYPSGTVTSINQDGDYITFRVDQNNPGKSAFQSAKLQFRANKSGSASFTNSMTTQSLNDTFKKIGGGYDGDGQMMQFVQTVLTDQEFREAFRGILVKTFGSQSDQKTMASEQTELEKLRAENAALKAAAGESSTKKSKKVSGAQ